MLLDAVRLIVAFGSIAIIVAFWHWLLGSLGTF